jgi:hypothetical protein
MYLHAVPLLRDGRCCHLLVLLVLVLQLVWH